MRMSRYSLTWMYENILTTFPYSISFATTSSQLPSSEQLITITQNTQNDYTLIQPRDTYQSTNPVYEYKQMTHWLEQWEKIYWHQEYITWLLVGKHLPVEWHPPDLFQWPRLQMAKHPSQYSVLLGGIINNYKCHILPWCFCDLLGTAME